MHQRAAFEPKRLLFAKHLSLLNRHPGQHPALHALAVHRSCQVLYQRIALGRLKIQSLMGFSKVSPV
jgi:hypothetical protein